MLYYFCAQKSVWLLIGYLIASTLILPIKYVDFQTEIAN